jgi:phosphoglycerol transferase
VRPRLPMATDTDVTDKALAAGARSPASALRGAWGIELAWLVATMALSLLVAAVVLRLWDAQLHIPIVADGDGLLNVTVVKGMIQHGWYLHNSSVGAPYGEHLNDFSGFDADTLQFLFLRILAFGTSDPAALVNVYYILGYPMVAGAAYAALRGFGISRPNALVTAVVFAALPYHFLRAEGHLFLGNYFAVPAAGWLTVRTLLGQPLAVRHDTGGRVRRWLTPVTIGTALAVIACGGSTLYYAVFAILLVGSAVIVRVVAGRGWRPGVPGVVVAVAIGVVLVLNLLPGLTYEAAHGHNPAVASRSAAESETYSGSLTQTVMPIPGHRIPALARLQAKFQGATTTHGEVGMQIGIVLSLSLFGLLIALLARSVRAERAITPRSRLVGAAAVALLLAILFDTYGGLGSLIANLISPQIRAWNRLTPFIAFFAVVGLAAALDAMAGRVRERAGAAWRGVATVLPIAVAVVVGLVAIWDMTTPGFVPLYKATAASWRSDQRFVTTLEHTLPHGAMVLQLPFHAFPEATGEGTMIDYDEFRGYVHSTDLRWSYGAMKGRPEDWTSAARDAPLSSVLPAAVAAGFVGVYVDQNGYADKGVAIRAQLQKLLGVDAPTDVSEDGRLVYYDASKLASQEQAQLTPPQRTALAETLLKPIAVTYGGGLGPVESDATSNWNWVGLSGSMTIVNSRGAPRKMVLSTDAASTAQSVLRITAPGRPVKVVRFPHVKTPVKIRFTAPAGTSTVALSVDGPDISGADPRDLRAQLFSLHVGEDVTVPRVRP